MQGKASLVVVRLAVVVLVVSSLILCGACNNTGGTVRPPPTYTGSTPLAITSNREAIESNNDFILVFTPCKDETLNASVLSTTVTAANMIRAVDGIYVGAFTLPQDNSLDYPTVMVRHLIKSTLQYTFRADLTENAIYNQYINYKFLGESAEIRE